MVYQQARVDGRDHGRRMIEGKKEPVDRGDTNHDRPSVVLRPMKASTITRSMEEVSLVVMRFDGRTPVVSLARGSTSIVHIWMGPWMHIEGEMGLIDETERRCEARLKRVAIDYRTTRGKREPGRVEWDDSNDDDQTHAMDEQRSRRRLVNPGIGRGRSCSGSSPDQKEKQIQTKSPPKMQRYHSGYKQSQGQEVMMPWQVEHSFTAKRTP